MDMSGMSTEYSSYLKNSAAAKSRMQNINGKDYSKASETEMMDACKQFEEYLVEMVMKEVTKTVDMFGTGDNVDAGTATMQDIMKDKMVQTMSEKLSQDVDLGIAKRLYESMQRQYSNVISAEEIAASAVAAAGETTAPAAGEATASAASDAATASDE